MSYFLYNAYMTIFQKIINKEIPADVIYEDDKVIAFNDINPKRPGHFLVVPKKLSINFYDIDDETLQYLIVKARELAIKVTKEIGVDGFNVIVNNGEKVGQEVFHTHVHIIPAKK